MSPADLRKRVRYWKNQLNLRAWTIRLVVIPCKDLPDNHAQVDYRADHDRATIRIRENEPNSEYWLVHELLHLVLAGLRPDHEGYNLLEEMAINRIARALCKAHKISCPPESEL